MRLADLDILLLRRISPGSGGHARGVLRVWPAWEWIARRVWPTTSVPHSVHHSFDVHIAEYRGGEMRLSDGAEIRSGDRVMELHINNRAWIDVNRESPWRVVAMFRDDLIALATWLSNPEVLPDTRALYGVTLLDRGAALLGFSVRQRPINLRARLDRLFMTGLLALYTPGGSDRLKRGSTFGTYPREIWMSRVELIRRFRPSED